MTILIGFVLNEQSRAQSSNARMERGFAASETYRAMFTDGNGPNPFYIEYEAFFYPAPFLDVHFENSNGQTEAVMRFLAYLEFYDGYSVLDRDDVLLRPDEYITRGEAIKMLFESRFQTVRDDYDGYFDDVDEDHPYAKWIEHAYEDGIVDYSNDFDPDDDVRYGEFVEWALRVRQEYGTFLWFYFEDNSLFFTPGVYTPTTLGISRGIEQGVFNHYTKNTFSIPDIRFSVDFDFHYSTSMVELPEKMYPLKPLGRGWTHSYNSYIYTHRFDNDDFYFIVWPDGTVHLYNEDHDEYETESVYDKVREDNGDDIIEITKTSQVIYRYEKIDSDRDLYYLILVTDANGNEVSIDYESADEDDTRRIRKVTGPSGENFLNFYYCEDCSQECNDNCSYDCDDCDDDCSFDDFLYKVEDHTGRSILFRYDDDFHRLKYFYDAKCNPTKYYYFADDEDADGNHSFKRHLLCKVKMPRGNVIEADYDDNNGKLKERSEDNGDSYARVNLDYTYNDDYNPRMGSTVETRSANGEEVDHVMRFNKSALPTSYSNGATDISIDYPSNGIHLRRPNEIVQDGLEVDYDYDDDGNVKEKVVSGGNLELKEEWTYYSGTNRVQTYTNARGHTTSYTYDDYWNVNLITDPLGFIVDYDHNPTTGLLEKVTNQESIATDFDYFTDGPLMKSTIGSGQDIVSIDFLVDDLNRVTMVTNNEQKNTIGYDDNDNVTLITRQLDSETYTTTTGYNENDLVDEVENARGFVTDIIWDDDHDRVEEEDFEGIRTEHFYDSDSGQYEGYEKPLGDDVEILYDDEGRIEEVYSDDDTPSSVEIDYNSDNLLRSISNDWVRYRFGYNDLNRIEAIRDTERDINRTYYDWDNNDNIKSIIYPSNWKNVEAKYTYDANDRLIRLDGLQNGSNIFHILYEYFKDGRPKITRYFNRNSEPFFSTRYVYDDIGRPKSLRHSRITTSISEMYVQYEYVWDEYNNVREITTAYGTDYIEPVWIRFPNGLESNNTYSPTNFIQNGYEVNDDGQVKKKGSYVMEYDVFDRLKDVVNTEESILTDWDYDPYGNLISARWGDVRKHYVWDIVHNNILVEYTNNNQSTHLFHGTGLEARLLQDGSLEFFLSDHRGNVVATVDETGEILKEYLYDDFGNVTNQRDVEFGSFTFLGKYGTMLQSLDMGLYYIKARFYDAESGRFLTQDPVWSENLYSYSGNNPFAFLDYDGREKNSALSYDIRVIGSTLEYLGENISQVGFPLSLSPYTAPVGLPVLLVGEVVSAIGAVTVVAVDTYNGYYDPKTTERIIFVFAPEALDNATKIKLFADLKPDAETLKFFTRISNYFNMEEIFK